MTTFTAVTVAFARAASRAPASPRPARRARRSARRRSASGDDEKMFVPAGAFGGVSPERRASELMSAMLTYVSAWIVIAQLENVAPRRSVAGEDAGDDGEGEARRVTTSHEFLLDYLEANPVRDGEQWLIALTRANPTLAERIMAVRRAYAEEDFRVAQRRQVDVRIHRGGERARDARVAQICRPTERLRRSHSSARGVRLFVFFASTLGAASRRSSIPFFCPHSSSSSRRRHSFVQTINSCQCFITKFCFIIAVRALALLRFRLTLWLHAAIL